MAAERIDIKDLLKAADKRDYDWYDKLSKEEKKIFNPLVPMKFLSAVEGSYSDHYLEMTNDFLNVGFWDLTDHPELVWKIFCIVGSGRSERHTWIKMASSKASVSKIDKILLKQYPHLDNMELEILKKKFTVDTLKDFLKDLAMTDKEIKPIVEDFKKKYDNSRADINRSDGIV
jgi:hypothetical protein